MIFLDVFVGLILIYAILSLVCTAFNEMILNNLIRLRSRILEKGIVNMLCSGENMELVQRFYSDPIVNSLHLPGRMPSYLPAKTFAVAVLNQFVEVDEKSNATMKSSEALDTLPGSVRETIERFMMMANHNYKEMVSLTETWFDNATDRMAGWYRRKMQAIGLVIAVLLTIALNADSIARFDFRHVVSNLFGWMGLQGRGSATGSWVCWPRV